MSNDLISRDDAIQFLNDLNETRNIDYSVYSDMFDYLDITPTVYDIDKVVERLQSEVICEKKGACMAKRHKWIAEGLNRAIEIVKGGGMYEKSKET